MKKDILAALCVFSVVSAQAVIVATGDGTQNTNGPAVGWDYVGRITAANGAPSSVTYISNNWFITANHIKVLDNPTGAILGGSSYTIDPGSWTQMTNSVGTGADLMMFRVNENVGLPGMTVRSTAPAAGTAVTMIGNGLDRFPDLVSASGEQLYLVKSGTANTSKRWGTNTIEGTGGVQTIGYGDTDTFYTDFDLLTDQAQGETYDSGGGVFTGSGASTELAGIMVAIAGRVSVSGTNAVVLTGGGPVLEGSVTYIADFSVYADQINTTTAIPEPSVLVMALVAPAAAFFIRRTFMM